MKILNGIVAYKATFVFWNDLFRILMNAGLLIMRSYYNYLV